MLRLCWPKVLIVGSLLELPLLPGGETTNHGTAEYHRVCPTIGRMIKENIDLLHLKSNGMTFRYTEVLDDMTRDLCRSHPDLYKVNPPTILSPERNGELHLQNHFFLTVAHLMEMKRVRIP